MNEKKVVTLDVLGAAVDKIKETYPTQSAVTQQISEAALGGGVTYATEAEVLALFDSAPQEDAPTE